MKRDIDRREILIERKNDIDRREILINERYL